MKLVVEMFEATASMVFNVLALVVGGVIVVGLVWWLISLLISLMR